jgi:hypothetical protein
VLPATILADVPAGARIHSEETFGPVLVAQPGPESMADFTETRWITTRDGTGHYPI